MQAQLLWRAMKARWRNERAELSAIRQHIKPGDTVFDIGAHKGSFTFWLSRWVGPAGRVVAFEPQPALADYLRRVMARPNVTIEQMALADRGGELPLFVPSANSPAASLSQPAQATGATRRIVPVTSLDAYVRDGQRISALKIDAEGAELAIFKGAVKTLRAQKPLLLFECEQRHLAHGSIRDVFAFLGDLGYRGEFFSPSGLRPLAEFDASVHQNQGQERFWDRPGYCNNFLFRIDR